MPDSPSPTPHYQDAQISPVSDVLAPSEDIWLPASSIYNFAQEDPLLDWLNLYGEAAGYIRDNDPSLSLYNPDLDFAGFVIRQGERFESGVLRILGERFAVYQIGHKPSNARDPALIAETISAMSRGVPIIVQAPLRDPLNHTYGMVDLLVRSDQLAALLTDSDGSVSLGLSDEDIHTPAPVLGEKARTEGWHYVVVDIKFATLDLLRDGHAAKSHLAHAIQVWLYNEALGAMQGFTPAAGYLLGRTWQSGSGATQMRGKGCLERLARIDRDHTFEARGANKGEDQTLKDIAMAALDWGRRVRSQGADWRLLPTPSADELYPNMKNDEDFPWHATKRKLAAELGELTLLPSITPKGRTAAFKHNIRRWDTPGLTAADLGIITPSYSRLLSATLAANSPLYNDAPRGDIVLPGQIPDTVCPGWKTPADIEFFVDFETVSNLDDDFSTLPLIGGQPLIFKIGCGHYESETPLNPHDKLSRSSQRWVFQRYTVDRLNEADEARIIKAWVAYMESQLARRGLPPFGSQTASTCRIIHWSPAETSFLENSHDSARTRQRSRNTGDDTWPNLPFFDMLNLIVKATPVTVRGAFNFGLKSIAKALHDGGLIEAAWADGPADGLGAMVGAWACEARAARTGEPISTQPLMRSIGDYNEIDCQTMAETLTMLRER
jgi:hypothetical protein